MLQKQSSCDCMKMTSCWYGGMTIASAHVHNDAELHLTATASISGILESHTSAHGRVEPDVRVGNSVTG